jgi:GNAT superfamily N-acetyltransferase
MITESRDRATVAAAARLWVRADERRAGRTFDTEYARAQEAGFSETVERPETWLAVARAGGEVIGLVGGFPATDDDGLPIPALAYLAWVAVAPPQWGEGIGTQLLDHAAERARRSGCTAVTLWTHTDNERARRVYERAGWHATGATMRTPVGDEELLEYRLDLTGPAT